MDPMAIKLLIFVGIVVVSIGCGWLVSTGLRLRETMGRVSLVVFLVLFSLFPFAEKVVDGRPWYEALKWGIDLAGGTNLVYELEREPTDSGMMERMVGAIRKRVDPSGTQELAIRQVGKDRVEIIIPRASTESVARIKSMIQKVGSLEFHILANEKDHKDIIRRAQNVERDLYDSQKRLIAGWRPIKPKTVKGQDGKPKQVPNDEFYTGDKIAVRQIKGAEQGFNEVLVVYEPDPKLWVTGKYLRRAREGMDEGGRPAVDFSFDLKGASLFARLTSDNKPDSDGFRKHLAIILDDNIESAPTINSVISSNGQITGTFTQEEVKSLVSVLNAGALEVPLKKDPISEFTISPLLGVDVQTKGITAMIAATVAILVFMAIYYMWLGAISDICLLINLVLLIGTMAFIDATFTLPGLAGVVLTMGMAVDANVLIYERMREELERGASLRMSIQNGFSRAFSSIFDSNITTLLTAVILYMIGSDQVKGFAVTLFIGLAISMYTALTVNRLMLEIVERKRWLKQFRMCSVFGVTNFDFVGKQLICGIGSIVVIGAGLAAVALRGENNLDIDFSGGTMVTVEFNESQNADDVRNKLEQAFKSDITLEQLTSHNDANAHKRFRIRTTDQDDVEVQKIINEAFPNQLKRNTMEYSKLAEVPKNAEPKEGEGISPQKGDFPGGHMAELKFSSEAATDTMVRYFAASLASQKNEKGESLFKDADAAETFFSIRGAKEEEKKSDAGQMQRYTHMTLRTDVSIPAADVEKALAQMQQTLANSPEFDEVNNFESSVARETQQSAILAMVASLIMIVIYIWFRFQNVYFGLAAVLALLHDVLATLGMVALAAYVSRTPIGPYLLLSDFKVNLTMIAAFLTIVGYSLNDTIVIFDRIREIRGKNPSFTRGMVNLAVNQTLSRTILTAGTVFITVVILYAMGGEGIHGFAYAMLIGTVVGCYSTIYVASPFVLYLMEKYQKSSQTPQAAAPVGAARS